MKKLFIAIILVLVGVFSQAQSVWDGSRQLWARGTGSQDDPFLIESAANLAYLSYMVGKGFNTQGLYFKLTTDIDLNGSQDQQWIPIGLTGTGYDEDGCERNTVPLGVASSDLAFKGHFDGDNHKIENIYVNNGSDAGLFGRLASSLDDITVVENIFISSGYVYGENSGGIVGNSSSNGNILVSRCYNGAYIEGMYAGGIVGKMTVSIFNCKNTGLINGFSAAGGIVGWAAKEIGECSNSGKVIGEGFGGGIVGGGSTIASLQISNCYNTGEIEVSGANVPSGFPGSPVGGLIGELPTTGGGLKVMTNCYNVGTVICENYEPGALVGLFHGEISNSYYLNTCGGAGEGTPKTSDEMRNPSFVDILNLDTDVWCADTLNSNYGYPILGANNMAVNEQSIATMKVYPNPTNGQFTVEGSGILCVFNTLGQLVLTQDVHEKATLELSQGLYFIRLEGENSVKMAKVVVK
jgi:hypothetical protein